MMLKWPHARTSVDIDNRWRQRVGVTLTLDWVTWRILEVSPTILELAAQARRSAPKAAHHSWVQAHVHARTLRYRYAASSPRVERARSACCFQYATASANAISLSPACQFRYCRSWCASAAKRASAAKHASCESGATAQQWWWRIRGATWAAKQQQPQQPRACCRRARKCDSPAACDCAFTNAQSVIVFSHAWKSRYADTIRRFRREW